MIRKHWHDLAFLVLALGVLGWIGWDAFAVRLITFYRGSDYWEHSAVLHALLENPWHPRHPLVADDVPSPRFGPHFLLIALVGRLFGVDALGAMSMTAVLNVALLLGGIYLFFRRYFRDPRAPLFALIVMLGTWWEGPHFSNVYQLPVLFSVASYPSTAALGLTLLGLSLVLELLHDERERWGLFALACCGWAYVYITHPLTAVMSFTSSALLCLTEPGVPRRRRFVILASLPVALLLAGLWPYYPALQMVARGTLARLEEGHPSGTPQVHPFYKLRALLEILGFAVLAVPLIPYFLFRRRHLFVALGALSMAALFVASAFLPIPLGHRFILLTVFFLQVALVWLLLTLVPREPTGFLARRPVRIAAGLGVAAFLVYLAVFNVNDARARFSKVKTRGESLIVRHGRRIGAIAGPNGIVLATPLDSWVVPTFGPKIVALHHRNPLIRDGAERDRAVSRFFSRSAADDERKAILKKFNVTHVLFVNDAGPAERFMRQNGKLFPVPGGKLFAVKR